MLRFLLSFLFVFPVLQGSCFALTVTFHEEAEVTASHVILADVAAFDKDSALAKALASKQIAFSPKAGASITVNKGSIKDKLLRQIPETTQVTWEGAPSTLVTRLGISIGPQDIEAAITEYLFAKSDDLPRADYSFVPHELPLPFTIPTGAVEIDVIPANPDVIGSRRFTLIYKVDGTIVKNISIRGKLKAMTPVAVLTQNVKRGSILHPNMVQLQTKDLGKLRSPCTDLREVLGKRLTRSLRSGVVLDLSSIEFPPVIRKGQLVKILLRNKGLQLSATGISSMNGKQDQIIRVINAGSKKMIYCKVLSPGIVEVQI
ncbi:flagellar basal body P-ring formation protein FlgA [Desulfocapsa sp. AH-315-G09]|nr:flagellar basal body P-ring formation protein FlgA [Desulfocapsa sp.]MBN4065075.1 flagellar basal body P-ring formation protein FlgA [Desulfocapsa sp. AH-315-G09]